MCALSFRFSAQNQKIESMRVAFINDKLKLTPQEAQVFWPIYNEYLDKMKAIRREKKKLYLQSDINSNETADDFINKKVQLEQTEMQYIKDYSIKFKKAIGNIKTALLFKSEEEFKQELLKVLKSDKND